MPRKPRWEEEKICRGYFEIAFSRWQSFYEFVQQQMLGYDMYIWRGQADPDWKLVPSVFRNLLQTGQFLNATERQTAIQQHLQTFKYAVRGCGSGLSSIDNDDEWWAYGQHYGLSTPLLDWTYSPFVAAYFAAREINQRKEMFTVWALQPYHLVENSLISIINPMNDRNMRLQVQGGLFTQSLIDQSDIKIIVESNAREFIMDDNEMTLIKCLIPAREKKEILRSLNRMNINHKSLFPDSYGAAKFANMHLDVKNY